jgi:hypothetical protein
MRRFWSAAQRRVKKVDGDVRTAWHDDDDPGTYKQLRAPARRRPTRGDEGGVSGGGGAVVHGGAAHLARRRQAAVVCGILTGGLGRGSGRLRIEVRPDRGPPGGFNARSVHVARQRGGRTHDGQSHPARPINTRHVAG